jgi:hypothetical protein
MTQAIRISAARRIIETDRKNIECERLSPLEKAKAVSKKKTQVQQKIRDRTRS